ncbi:MAG: ABC transporter substrate-binding protein [Synergistaceae bacterium]|jgi:peptide/nickel transport system substrate-binding protein|nr:ABC transporter substrate-binding protein [Synergistaceae bacterium]
MKKWYGLRFASFLALFTVFTMLFAGYAFTAETQERTLTIAMNMDMRSVDPALVNTGTNFAVLYNVYAGLFRIDVNAVIQNDLAIEYKIVDDTTWEFTMRDDVYFHNGDKLTAEDMAFALNRVREDATLAQKVQFDVIEEATALDATHLRIKTKRPLPILKNLLAMAGSQALPKKYIEEKGWPYFLEHPIGCGPYVLESYIRDDSVTLKPFDKYYGKKNPDWDKIVIRVIPESTTRVGELLSGNVNIINQVIPNEWDRIDGNDGTTVFHAKSSRTYMLSLMTSESFPTSNQKVREAVDYAIDDKLIVDKILRGTARVVQTRYPEGLFGSEPSLIDSYNYDPERAKTLLKEAGYSDGFEMTFQCSNGSSVMDSEIAQAIAAMLRQVGIKVNLELLVPSAYNDVYASRTVKDAFMCNFGLGYFDPSYGLNSFSTNYCKGLNNWADPYFNETFDAARANMNDGEREQAYRDLQKYVAEQRPYVFICNITVAYGIQEKLGFTGRMDDVFDILNIKGTK